MMDAGDIQRLTLRDDCSRECTTVNAVEAGVSTARPAGHAFRLVNTGAKTVFVRTGTGATTCTTGTGHPILAGGEIEIKVESETHVYAITAAGESTTLVICPTAEA